MRVKSKTLTLFSLLFSLFFLCDFVDMFLFGDFFFTLFLGMLTIHIGLMKVIMLEASITFLDCIFDCPVTFVTSVFPLLENMPFFGVITYCWIIIFSILEITLVRLAYRRYLPKQWARLQMYFN